MIACERMPHARAAEAAGGARARRGEPPVRGEAGLTVRLMAVLASGCAGAPDAAPAGLRLLLAPLPCSGGRAAACSLAAAGEAVPPPPPLAGLADLQDGGDDSSERRFLRPPVEL